VATIREPIIDHFIELTAARKPWAFARFNDGEMGLIMRTMGHASRGHQKASESLREALLDALVHRQENYYVGIPSPRFGEARDKAIELLGDDHPTMVESTALTHHWRTWVDKFPDVIQGRPVTWVVGRGMNIESAPLANAGPTTVITVPSNNAWEFWQKSGGDPARLRNEAIVLMSCGPLSRVLTRRWFERRPDCTFVEVGTLYDPWTRNIKRKYHRRF
jgi:hypothetical protein